MFDIGWTEMLVIAVVMIVVVGPKDLPKMLRTFGKTTAKLRAMAGDFQKQFNEALKEAELDDVKKSVDSLRSLNPTTEIKKQLNPFEKAAADVRAGLDTLKPKPPEPASPVAAASEPLKNGAAAMPGEAATPPASTPAASTPAPAAVAAAAATGSTAAAQPAAKAAAPKKAAKPRAPKKTAVATGEAKPKAAPRKKKTESSAT
ncbi:Sec-independent protein translocase protein TatB [Mesorhizobium sp. YM1C-6-2]|uniref:Sec-independent protein translocase protein TatB n=1 Tax=Mesorhizobium sp. YM1C-6-2 TaxID=1827501 RepID=UPI000EF27F44|nr:Sec-independent protein translocase protein TatB [Mesorhizobium sp. YM1C-6-2]RLP27771.1 twin-arginine translocase subunit TatB [Mesorhizobium sp. YM1C-6-2]